MTQKENETSLKVAIKKLFKMFRIPYYSNAQGLGSVRGRPDLEAIWKGITYYIECKHPKEGGRMSQYQRAQRDKIELAGAPYVKARSVEDVVKALGLPVKGLF
jgi:hypothetical protein